MSDGRSGGESLPGGIVTFLFTDIEGSTRLLHRLEDRYAGLLERHREIIREAVSANGGREVSVDGDALFAAFPDAAGAIAACAVAQERLSAEPWPDGARVRVRMGIHSGLASPRDGDYVALAVHQASRVMAAGHGGQVLVSEATAALLEDRSMLVPLGRFRLRDFDEPAPLYQLRTDEAFPALRALPADRHNLVPPLTRTVGRDETVSEVAGAVRPGRLVTLVGPGGVGKTRVAVEVGMSIAASWTDGVWRADLAEVADPALVPSTIAEAVGVPRQGAADRWAATVEHLASRELVVLLDNCEHLVAACREAIGTLLAACPRVAVLATSREPLRMPGEQVRRIDPLPFPDAGAVATAVAGSAAGRLFLERATAVAPAFEITDTNAATVAAICRRLDGLPLYLELAAAQLAFQSPSEILAGLEDRLALLRSRDPGIADRHRTARALLDWSYRLLPPSEQAVLRRLSVFGAGFSLETASPASAGDDIDPGEVPDLVWSLVERSLVSVDPGESETRYRLLETVRAFGRTLLDPAEAAATAERLARWYLERIGPWLPADERWVGAAGTELGNLRSVMGFLPTAAEEDAQLLACTIGRHHDATQSFRDGIDEVGGYVERFRLPSPARVSLLTILADLRLRTGDVEAARGLVEEAAALRAEHGAPPWDDVGVDRSMGEVARRSGDLEGAASIARRALARPLTDRGRSRMYNLLGTTAAALGDLEGAYDACARELELNRAIGYDGYITSAEGNLAEVAMRLGDVPSAARHQRACLRLAVAQGSTAMVAFSLIVAARIAGTGDDWEDAVRLHARAEAMLSELGLVLYADDRAESDRLLDAAVGGLGRGAFDRLEEEGRAMPVPDAVEAADRVLDDASGSGEE